ncbi:hypothetical protein [Saccharothrix saharensis]|uniref:hypothetical protein n=1 Tax=Saccharothrix saharensis TaxID=571190 RepID=UPI0011531DCC|nr:hypothetical protein [Saccharothrix saharensis]
MQHTVADLLRDIRNTRRLPEWIANEPTQLLDLVHAQALEGRAEHACELLVELWPLVPAEVDELVLRRLHECGVFVASVLPTSLLVARACRLGAGVLRHRGLYRLAAAQGMFELAVHRLQDNDPDAIASALLDLAATYRAEGRMHRVIGCLDEALETYGLCDDSVGFARMLNELGGLMIEVDRCDAAVKHLTRAATTYRQLGHVVSAAQAHALLSRAHRLLGNHHAADRALNRALAPVVGVDDATARRLRDVAAGVSRLGPNLP